MKTISIPVFFALQKRQNSHRMHVQSILVTLIFQQYPFDHFAFEVGLLRGAPAFYHVLMDVL